MHQPLISLLQERGYIHQCTNIEGIQELTDKKSITAYIGFDMTADSLHVGSLIPIMLLRRLQQTGHRPVVLLGGGTTRVGDPSGKDESRKILDDETMAKNMAGIRKIFEKFLRFGDGETDAIVVNNDDWLRSLNYIDFLRDYGKHFTINRMLTFDSVKLRLDREQPLTFLEFNYMLLQAYDFMELNRTHDVVLQMGGSDQWGNIVNGIDLTRRLLGKEVFGMTTPLLTTASGAKMGKSANGAVWLNEERLSHFDYWQFWRNTEDADVGKFLRLFTDLPMEEIATLEKLEGAEINKAKIILANEATKMCRGEEAARVAQETAEQTFAQGGAGDGLPTLVKTTQELEQGIGLLSVLTDFGFAKSNGEARRHVQSGAVRVNDSKIEDANTHLSSADMVDGVIKVSLGKKKHGLIKA